ncbi:MAG: Uncharacterised protein [Marinobacterium sp. xm-d-530]|nr:MAG: Uncharacterised protein [Marinobacterium sp. xm-d-530]
MVIRCSSRDSDVRGVAQIVATLFAGKCLYCEFDVGSASLVNDGNVI